AAGRNRLGRRGDCSLEQNRAEGDWGNSLTYCPPRTGVGLTLGFAFVLLRTVMVCSPAAGVGDFSRDFFVLGQIKRQGCVFIVSLNSATLRPTGSSSRMVDFSFSDESRKFCSVTVMFLFLVI